MVEERGRINKELGFVVICIFVSLLAVVWNLPLLDAIERIQLKKEVFVGKNSFNAYYKELLKKCRSSCCKGSVRIMARGKYLRAEAGGCPKGYKLNMLKCIDSYRWCEPKKDINQNKEINSKLDTEVLIRRCHSSGGEWKQLPDPCSNRCDYQRSKEALDCIAVVGDGCQCAKGMCWNGSECEPL